jgi:hypothetical protein
VGSWGEQGGQHADGRPAGRRVPVAQATEQLIGRGRYRDGGGHLTLFSASLLRRCRGLRYREPRWANRAIVVELGGLRMSGDRPTTTSEIRHYRQRCDRDRSPERVPRRERRKGLLIMGYLVAVLVYLGIGVIIADRFFRRRHGVPMKRGRGLAGLDAGLMGWGTVLFTWPVAMWLPSVREPTLCDHDHHLLERDEIRQHHALIDETRRREQGTR